MPQIKAISKLEAITYSTLSHELQSRKIICQRSLRPRSFAAQSLASSARQVSYHLDQTFATNYSKCFLMYKIYEISLLK